MVMELAEKHAADMPISREVYRVADEGATPSQAYRGLLRVTRGSEQDPG